MTVERAKGEESGTPALRKIIHVDMDAFYASVEQRDDPSLRDRPIAVNDPRGWGIVATASYEARKHGVRSGMPVGKAKVMCPELRVVEARLGLYQQISAQIADIYAAYTDLIEPVQLDEAYLDVTERARHTSATAIAREIRTRIASETGLTASAGVSFNKFMAKLASDAAKPNGLLVLRPERAADFVAPLPVELFHGVGPATREKLRKLGVNTGLDLRGVPSDVLHDTFGKNGYYLYEISRGEDNRPVQIGREKKSHSVETSFRTHLRSLDNVKEAIVPIARQVWVKCSDAEALPRGIGVKVRFADFRHATKSRSLPIAVESPDDIVTTCHALLNALPPFEDPVRLLGVFASNLVKTDRAPSQEPDEVGNV